MLGNSGFSFESQRERQTSYETAVIDSLGLVIRVTVELREVNTFTRSFERTGNWFSCVTDKDGHILGGSTAGSGNLTNTPLEIAQELLTERLREGWHQ
jgi:hypothetical protein